MCGIVGAAGNIIKRYDHTILVERMIDTIRYRGPDDSGTYFNNKIALGHTRLSIIDIEHGKQPMQSADGRYTLVFNGEIYNYIELRQELIAKGYLFRTYSDSEVLLYTYIEYGKDAVHYLNGMFVFCIYDCKEDLLFIARDHFGIKPLYYFQGNDGVIFASEIKALLKHPEVPRQMNLEAVYEYLSFQFCLNSKTMFKDIYKLEPATYIVISGGRIVERKHYWDINFKIDDNKTEDEYASELLVLLESSLSLQVRSDVPIGSYLSGGLDSSIVSILASKNYFGKLKTFTGGFKDYTEYDETRYAKIVCNNINGSYFEIFPTSRDFADVFEKLIYYMDEPGGGPGIFPQYMVSKLASENVKVVLGGLGGDEVFGGYARYTVAYLEQCIKGTILETHEEGKHVVTLQSILPNLSVLKQYIPLIRKHFSRGLFEEMDRRYFALIDRSPNQEQLYEKNFLERRNEEKLFVEFSSIFNNPGTLSLFNKMTYFDIKTLLPTLLQIEDRMSMSVSLESRVPLLDVRIVELAGRMPPTLKFAGGKTKYMLIKAVKNILPKEITARKDKMGFPVPINEWFAGELKGYLLDVFRSRKTIERGIFDCDGIERCLTGGGGEKFSRDLWGALNLEIWIRNFID